MSFINEFSDFTVSTSSQPSSTATQRFLQLYDKSCTSPLLSLPSILAELRTSLGGCHSLLASLTETPHLLFSTSMLLDRSRPLRSAVLTDQASRRGSHVYKINTGLWNFGRPQPRIGGLSVAKTERARRQFRSETSRHAAETKKARKRAVDHI